MQTYTSLENILHAIEKNEVEESANLRKLLSLSEQNTSDIVSALKVLYEKRSEKISRKSSHAYAKKGDSETKENITAKTLASLALASENEGEYSSSNS